MRRALLAFTVETEGGAGNARAAVRCDHRHGARARLVAVTVPHARVAREERRPRRAALAHREGVSGHDARRRSPGRACSSAAPTRRELDPAKATGFPSGDARSPSIGVPSGRRTGRSSTSGCVHASARRAPGIRRPRRRAPTTATVATRRGAPTRRARKATTSHPTCRCGTRRTFASCRCRRCRSSRTCSARCSPPGTSRDGHVVQIGTDLLRDVARACAAIDSRRRPTASRTRSARSSAVRISDVYVVDVKTGERRKALEKVRFFYGGSPTGASSPGTTARITGRMDVATGTRDEPDVEGSGDASATPTTTTRTT